MPLCDILTPLITPSMHASTDMIQYDPIIKRVPDQYPGGLTRWDSLVHFGSSVYKLAYTQWVICIIRWNILCMPFLYFFSFLSKMVYLSLGSISCSVGISFFHNSTALVVIFCLAKALSTVATTKSTALRRFRCRAFWNLESRQGIFLYHRWIVSKLCWMYLQAIAIDLGAIPEKTAR